jgi:hypothetical protein
MSLLYITLFLIAAMVNPQGNETYWFEGLSFEGMKTEDVGEELYWFEGLPCEPVFAPTSEPPIPPEPGEKTGGFNPLFFGTNF